MGWAPTMDRNLQKRVRGFAGLCSNRAATLSREAEEKILLLKNLSLDIYWHIILSKSQFVESGEANMRSKYDISDCTVKNVVYWKVTPHILVEIYQTDNNLHGENGELW